MMFNGGNDRLWHGINKPDVRFVIHYDHPNLRELLPGIRTSRARWGTGSLYALATATSKQNLIEQNLTFKNSGLPVNSCVR